MNEARICPLTRMPCMGKKCIALIERFTPGYNHYAYRCKALDISILLDDNGSVINSN